ncbi:MAG: 4a-hydroxytetrahydrobiopterin dehydratase [Gammaproteobacteria bacterium]|nr:4a-hydroxytetrahydrobiopterin dehydratase [Gammaproteobacteria bacterium]
MITKASNEQIQDFLASNSSWSVIEGKLHREYTFASFTEAFAFMNQLADIAEKHNHHPELYNCYNKVVIDLTTHETSGISQRDFDFINAIK